MFVLHECKHSMMVVAST